MLWRPGPPRTAARRAAAVIQDPVGSTGGLPVAEIVELGRTPHHGLIGREGSDDRRAVADAIDRCGVSTLAVLHDLDLAARLCDGVIVLDEGRVVAAGHLLDALSPRIMADVFGVAAATERRGRSRTHHLRGRPPRHRPSDRDSRPVA